ncbi:MAG TPA: recombinase family protein [Terriglobales bacterium]|nr:recombinase family protein [Terriglobales bacterium]
MPSIPAAQYLRMSTDRQEYSLDCQRAGIATFAQQHGFEVCQTYCDEARSGLDLERRAGLSQLLQDVVAGIQTYKAILVYDVSRWGRFQDPDEGAHYEFLCKAAGVQVHYCAELFPNNNEMSSMVLKTLKRVMAGEFSRELSKKVFEGLVRLVKKGYRTGSVPGYGFRRMLVSADRTRKQELPPGERKSIATDRVILIPGPPEELSTVREIYCMFVEKGKTFVEIAADLETRKIPFLPGKEWNDYAIKRILTHPKYKGTAVFNRTTERLGSKSRRLPESQWILVPEAFEPIVTQELFEAAQTTLRQKYWNRSNDEIMEQLKTILETHGYLSQAVLKSHGLSGTSVGYRFGSMLKAFELAGYTSSHKKTSEHRLQSRRIRTEMMSRLVEMFPGEVSISSGAWRRKNWLRLKNGPSVAFRVCRSINLAKKGRAWVLQATKDQHCPVTLIGVMNIDNTALEAFYLTGRLTNRHKINITERSDWLKNGIRLDDLRAFCQTVVSGDRS